MKKQILYILWDENDGYNYSKLYIDENSAEIGLYENYTEYWIKNSKAKIMSIEAVSYLNQK